MTPSADRQCFYDKQLLWRANLYMAEAGRDWNDLNSWTGDTEWNPEGTAGGQVVKVVPSTYPPYTGQPSWTDHKMDGAVAYSIETHDSPEEFNRKMGEQVQILDYMITNGTSPFAQQANGWSSYTAPPSVTDPNGGGSGLWANYIGVEAVELLPAGMEARPYRPAFSTAVGWNEETMRRSAGVDCVGLVQRSASYPGEKYHLPNVFPYEWDTELPATGRVYVLAEEDKAYNKDPANWYDLVKISEMDPAGDPPTGLDRIAPGDIVYYVRGEYQSGAPKYHVMIVERVEQAAGRQVTREDITVIEAVWGVYPEVGTANRVIQLRTLDQIDRHVGNGEEPRKWIAGRLVVGTLP